MTPLIRHVKEDRPVRIFICMKCGGSQGTMVRNPLRDGYVHKKCPADLPLIGDKYAKAKG